MYQKYQRYQKYTQYKLVIKFYYLFFNLKKSLLLNNNNKSLPLQRQENEIRFGGFYLHIF